MLLQCMLHSSGYFISSPCFADRKTEVHTSTTASVSLLYKPILKLVNKQSNVQRYYVSWMLQI